MLKKLALGVAMLGLTAGVTLAQTPTNFADVDTDGNGELSLQELQVVWPDFTEAEFNSADTDGSGGISVDELNAFQAGNAANGGAGAVPPPADVPAPVAQ